MPRAITTSRTNKNELRGWWPFDGGQAMDYSGNQHHGTLLNAPTVVSGPFNDLALKFNGSTQGVSIAGSTAFNTIPTNATGSICAWVNLTTTQDGIIVGRLTSGREVFQLRNNRTANNRIEFRLVINTSTPYAVNSTTLCSNITGKWTHVVGVADGTNLNIYINGRLEAQTAYTNGVVEGGTWGIGKDIPNNGTYLNGVVGASRVYARGLSAAEVQELYAERFALEGEPPPLFAGAVIAPVTGTLATTEAADTALFNGTVVTSGTLVATETADTALFNGTVIAPVTGTLAAAETADIAYLTDVVAGAVDGVFAALETADIALFSVTLIPPPPAISIPSPDDYGWRKRTPPPRKKYGIRQ